MSSKLPYFRWHPKDFDTDQNVRLMSMCEVGLYVLCLNHAWVNGALPDDVVKIAKIVGQPLKQVKRSWGAVSKCFTRRDDGTLVNPRQEEERSWAGDRRDKAKSAVELRDLKGAVLLPEMNGADEGEREEKGDPTQAYDSDSVSDSFVNNNTELTTKPSTRTRGPEVDFDTFLGWWSWHRRFKKPPSQFRERARVRWESIHITEEELKAAMDGYSDSEWARSQSFPMLGFLKDPHSWIAAEAKERWHSRLVTFRELYQSTRASEIDSDWDEAMPFCGSLTDADWDRADSHVVTVDGAFQKSPKNYFRLREFERKPRPAPRSRAELLLENA